MLTIALFVTDHATDLAIGQALGQTPQYRRPSDSDIEWLLGNGKPKRAQRSNTVDECFVEQRVERGTQACVEEPVCTEGDIISASYRRAKGPCDRASVCTADLMKLVESNSCRPNCKGNCSPTCKNACQTVCPVPQSTVPSVTPRACVTVCRKPNVCRNQCCCNDQSDNPCGDRGPTAPLLPNPKVPGAAPLPPQSAAGVSPGTVPANSIEITGATIMPQSQSISSSTTHATVLETVMTSGDSNDNSTHNVLPVVGIPGEIITQTSGPGVIETSGGFFEPNFPNDFSTHLPDALTLEQSDQTQEKPTETATPMPAASSPTPIHLPQPVVKRESGQDSRTLRSLPVKQNVSSLSQPLSPSLPRPDAGDVGVSCPTGHCSNHGHGVCQNGCLCSTPNRCAGNCEGGSCNCGNEKKYRCQPNGEPKGMTCTSRFGSPADCSCENCRGHVDEIVASTLIGDCYRKIANMKWSRSQHAASCDCWHCAELDNPDMVGDAAWTPGRFLHLSNDTGWGAACENPNMFLSRLNIAEHFNAEVRDRIWFDYRRMNNAVKMSGGVNFDDDHSSKAVDQFTFGLEKQFWGCSSLELRVPIYNQFDSSVDPMDFGQSGAELGNISLVYKYLFARNASFSFSGGLGLTAPTANDWKLDYFNAKLKNKTFNIVPYLGIQWHPNDSTYGHALLQFDVPLAKHKLELDDLSEDVKDQTIVRFGLQVGRWLYRNERGIHSCRLGGFLELDYSKVLDEGDEVELISTASKLLIGSTKNKPQTINFIAGVPVLFGQLSLTNAVILPFSSNERQFSVAYSFSASRRY